MKLINLTYIFILVSICSCKSSKHLCNVINTSDVKRLDRYLSDTLNVHHVNILNCEYVDKPFIYSKTIFISNYNKIKNICTEIIDSLYKCKSYNFFEENPEYRYVAYDLSQLKNSLEGDSILFLYKDSYFIEQTVYNVLKYYDSILPESMLLFFDTKLLELKRSVSQMQRDFHKSFAIMQRTSFVETYFSKKDYHIAVTTLCDNKKLVIMVYRYIENGKSKFVILNILEDGSG